MLIFNFSGIPVTVSTIATTPLTQIEEEHKFHISGKHCPQDYLYVQDVKKSQCSTIADNTLKTQLHTNNRQSDF